MVNLFNPVRVQPSPRRVHVLLIDIIYTPADNLIICSHRASQCSLVDVSGVDIT